MRVFLSAAWDDQAHKWSTAIQQVLRAFRLEVLLGDGEWGDKGLPSAIQEKIRACDALIAILTPNGRTAQTSSAVKEEVACAVGLDKRVFLLVHRDVSDLPLLASDRSYLRFSPDDAVLTFATAVANVANWAEGAGFLTSRPVARTPTPETLREEGWPESVIALYNQGLERAKAGDFDRARHFFGEIEALDPRCWRGVNALAMCDIYEGKFDEADQRLRCAIEDERWKAVPRALGYFWHNRGWVAFRRHGRSPDGLKQANGHYGKAIANDPSRNVSRLNLILNMLSLGDLLQAQVEFRAGLQHATFVAEFNDALAKLPEDDKRLIEKSEWIRDTLQNTNKIEQ